MGQRARAAVLERYGWSAHLAMLDRLLAGKREDVNIILHFALAHGAIRVLTDAGLIDC
jgi:hypothetical protein